MTDLNNTPPNGSYLKPRTVVRDVVDQHGKVVGTSEIAETELMRVEAFVDEGGCTWMPPTAWAYFAVCRALNDAKERLAKFEQP